MQDAIQTTTSVVRNWRICFIVASLCSTALLAGDDPPEDLLQRVAARESETALAQSNFLYKQTVKIEEVNDRGATVGAYQEVREIIFSPTQERSEQFVGKPLNTLFRLQMTEEDFRDIREIQPFLLTSDQKWSYQTKFRGEETVDNVDCYVIRIQPRQILDGQRLFDGHVWVSKQDYSIIRSEGKAVPEIRREKSENLFPHFTTIRQKVDGGFWFPAVTYGDDTLDFRGGAQRIKMTIRYSDYKRFGSDSKVKYDK